MKNSEKDILARFLQDTFSDYEPEPSDLTWENIRKEIQPQQPSVGAEFKQWLVPVVALLLLIGGVVFNGKNNENKTELALNSMKENGSTVNHKQVNGSRPFKGRLPYITETFVNKTTSKVESKVLPKVEQSLEVPTFSTKLTEPITKQNVQEYAVSTKEFVDVEDNNTEITNAGRVVQNPTSVRPNPQIALKEEIQNAGRVLNSASIRPNTEIVSKNNTSVPVNVPTERLINKTINSVEEDAEIQQIRYIKPLEMLKNKDFVLVKNEVSLPQITNILINKDPKPIRRPVYVSVSFTPLQTYRILTVNSQNVQNLQTNKLFDSERNGFAFELGITKSIGNKWNLRSGISYLKMRQWAEYQINTNSISVKNANNYSNNSAVVNNDNTFIEQTRIEQKTLQMIGLKADVQRFFKITGRNRYFISVGSQLMYESTQKQSNIFINVSAGFQHVVNKDCFLTIEPTASYLLNNINDSKSLIQTNAYNLGLKVGVNFKVK